MGVSHIKECQGHNLLLLVGNHKSMLLGFMVCVCWGGGGVGSQKKIGFEGALSFQERHYTTWTKPGYWYNPAYQILLLYPPPPPPQPHLLAPQWLPCPCVCIQITFSPRQGWTRLQTVCRPPSGSGWAKSPFWAKLGKTWVKLNF